MLRLLLFSALILFSLDLAFADVPPSHRSTMAVTTAAEAEIPPVSFASLGVSLNGSSSCTLNVQLPVYAGSWQDIDLPTDKSSGADPRRLGTCHFAEIDYEFYGEKLVGKDGFAHYAFAVRRIEGQSEDEQSLIVPSLVDRENELFLLSSKKKKGDFTSPDFLIHFKVSPPAAPTSRKVGQRSA